MEGPVDPHSKTSPLQALRTPSTRCPFVPEVLSWPLTSRPKPYVPCPGTIAPEMGPAEGATATQQEGGPHLTLFTPLPSFVIARR